VQAGVRWDHFESSRQSQKWSRNCAFAPFPVLVCSPYAYEDTQAPVDGDWFNRLGELGVTWQPSPNTSFFVRRNGTFRAPNLDELNKAAQTLRPQHGVTQELGWRQRAGERLSWSATWFDMRLQDEIHYGREPNGDEVNRNRDEASRRQGVELSGRWQPARGWRLNGMLSYLVPSLAGRTGDIPLVARTTASLTLDWQPNATWQTALSVRHVGPRRDGNATDADEPPLARLRAYQVVDAVLRYRLDDIELAFGVSNLFDERYSTIAYSQTYYPMPGRQAHTTLSVRF
jgi:outer membrane receptor protein involved in Fe transport